MTTDGHVIYTIISDTKTAYASGIDDISYSGSITIKEKITIDNIDYRVISVGSRAFYGSNITSVTLPNSIQSVGISSFDFSLLKGKLVIPQGVEFLDIYAFASTKLEYVQIPLSLKTITHGAFYANKALKGFIIDYNHSYYSVDKYGSLYNKNKTYLIQYALAHSYFKLAPTTICLTFKSCSYLRAKKVIVPKGVVYLEAYAFECINADIYMLADWFIPSVKSFFFSIRHIIYLLKRADRY